MSSQPSARCIASPPRVLRKRASATPAHRGPAPPAHRRAARRREPGFQLPLEIAASLGAKLATLARDTGGSLLVMPSRRTRADSLALPSRTCRTPFGTARARTPIFAFLALADAIVVTEDSVMVTEAAGTGKPVYVQALAGRSSRLSRFHRLMQERGATRPFEAWSY